MSDVRLVRRTTAKPSVKDDSTKKLMRRGEYELVTIGSSAGGPEAIHHILSLLPASFSLPIMITQHITKGFTKGMVKWLDGESELKVKEAEDGEILRKGNVYVAPDDYHFLVERRNGELIAVLSDEGICDGFRPAVTIMMESVAQICGDTAIGAILTGMGSDGAKGLLAMKQVGAYTFVQDKQSALVYGMPSSALNMGATKNIIPLDGIAKFLLKIAG